MESNPELAATLEMIRGGAFSRGGTDDARLVVDRLRELIEPLIPQRPARRGPGGRPRIDDRAALEGILSCSTPVVAGRIFPMS